MQKKRILAIAFEGCVDLVLANCAPRWGYLARGRDGNYFKGAVDKCEVYSVALPNPAGLRFSLKTGISKKDLR